MTVYKRSGANLQISTRTKTRWDADWKTTTNTSPSWSSSYNQPTTQKRAKPKGQRALYLAQTGRYNSLEVWCQSNGPTVNIGENSPDKQVLVGWPQSMLSQGSLTGYSGVAYSPSKTWAQLDNEALEMLRNNGVNLAVMLGEYRETADMFREISRRVYNAAKAYRSRDPRGFARAMAGHKDPKNYDGKTSAGNWLAWQYGIQPLAGFLLDTYDELVNRANRDILIFGKARNRTEAFRRLITTRAYDSNSLPKTGSRNATGRTVRQVKAVATYQNDFLHGALAQHGFTNPIAVVYELIPLSFVLDWFINFGEVLASLDNLLLFDKVILIRSERIHHSEDASGFGTARLEYQHRQRTFEVTNGLARLRYKPSTSRYHFLSGAALLRQLAIRI